MNKKTKNNIFKYFSISVILFGLFLVSKSSIPESLSITSSANASGTGGPIVLDGIKLALFFACIGLTIMSIRGMFSDFKKNRKGA